MDRRRMMKPLLAVTLLSLTLSLTAAEASAPRGPVHNERAAVLMARRIWLNLYPLSAAKVGGEAAWLAGEKATRDGDMWEVAPKNPGPDALGSNLVFRIAAEDGKMLGYYSP
jgi:hypothetical protein